MKKRTKGLLLIFCLFIVICFAVVLIVFNFLAKPSENSNDKFVPSTDADMYIDDDLYTTTPKKGSKVIDKDTGIQFVNNELIVYVKEGATQQDMDELLNENDAYVVGKNKTIGSYKLRFNKSYSYSELNEIIEIVQQKEIIDEASLNLVIQYSTNEYYPTSKEDRWTDDWNSIPSGANWGIEAINAPRAWEYIDLMQEINVGIFDQGFDVDHEDLKDIVKNSSLYPSNPQDHGTHVAGIIGAGFENGIGINGVCPTAHFSLYNYSEKDSDSDSFSYAMTYLVEYNNSKVINMSLGASPNIMFSASMGEVSAQKYIKSISVTCEKTINQLLSNYDFVICRSAGNNREYNYYKSNSATYGYYQADPDIPGNYFDNEGNSKKWNENSDPISGSEQVMANWDYLSLINDKGTKNHIITVGAVQNNSDNYPKYSLCSFSDIGGTDNDSIVDVVAPGYMIESTVPMSNNDGYEYKSGTSMASPHVAGVAAMLYSLDPNLMGDEVKQIICETATTEVDGYKLVDAEAAVKEVMGQGSLSANVVSSENDTSLSNVRIDAYIQLKSGEKLIDTGYTDSSGNLSMNLQGGNYEIKFNKDGYKTTATTIKISKDEITVLKDSIVMEKEEIFTSTQSSSENTIYSEDEWKQLYIDYINKVASETSGAYDRFSLIYLDSDNIPELYLFGNFSMAGDRLCWIYNDSVQEESALGNYGTSYIERGGLLINIGGRQGIYFDKVFSFDGKNLDLSLDGTYNEIYDDNGKTTYDFAYYIDGNIVTQTEYEEKITSVFDKSKAIQVSDDTYSKEEIIEIIENM